MASLASSALSATFCAAPATVSFVDSHAPLNLSLAVSAASPTLSFAASASFFAPSEMSLHLVAKTRLKDQEVTGPTARGSTRPRLAL